MSRDLDFWDHLQDIKNGKLITLYDGVYKFARSLTANNLEKGMKLGASYSATNSGIDYVELLGVYALHEDIQHDEEHLKHEHLHHSVKEALERLDAPSLARVRVGHKSYAIRLLVKDLEPAPAGRAQDFGDWYYLYNGRFCRGSGAEPLSFFEIKKV